MKQSPKKIELRKAFHRASSSSILKVRQQYLHLKSAQIFYGKFKKNGGII